MTTRGNKSSEKKSVYFAFIINIAVIAYGIHKDIDLAALSTALGAANLLIMAYVGGRSYVKGRNGENNE